jgi:anti-sigma28 factor (negative regulator of flagellin synthesis)
MALRSDESQRNQKVAVLAELFRSGNLPVDPEAIADAILREDQPDPAIQP